MHTFDHKYINRRNKPFILFTSVLKILEQYNYCSIIIHNNCTYNYFSSNQPNIILQM